ncbi:MAG: hypothetical protein ACI4AB_10570 [Acetatifactor sp.]
MEQVENRMVVDAEWQPMRKPVKKCDACKGELFVGDEYFDMGECICPECIEDYLKTNYRRLVVNGE